MPYPSNFVPDITIDSTIVYSGGENIRKFKNFAVRVVTLPVSAAVALAARNDVSYVSLNRDVLPMGHLSRTTGVDQIRNSGPSGTSRFSDTYETSLRAARATAADTGKVTTRTAKFLNLRIFSPPE